MCKLWPMIKQKCKTIRPALGLLYLLFISISGELLYLSSFTRIHYIQVSTVTYIHFTYIVAYATYVHTYYISVVLDLKYARPGKNPPFAIICRKQNAGSASARKVVSYCSIYSRIDIFRCDNQGNLLDTHHIK